MFEVSNQKAQLKNVNVRSEKHGPDKVLAADLKFSFKTSNDVLSEFDASLKSALYKQADDPQGELLDATELRAAKFPKLSTIGWAVDYAGYEFLLHYGVDEKSNVHVIDAKVNSFKFTCLDGGTVEVGFRVQINPTAAELSKICECLDSETNISLIAPTLEEQIQAELAE